MERNSDDKVGPPLVLPQHTDETAQVFKLVDHVAGEFRGLMGRELTEAERALLMLTLSCARGMLGALADQLRAEIKAVRDGTT